MQYLGKTSGGTPQRVISEDGGVYQPSWGIFSPLDTTPPEIVIVSPQGIVSTNTVDVLVSIVDTDSGVDSYRYEIDGEEIPSSKTSLDLTYYEAGEHSFTVSAIDNVGNTNLVTVIFTYSPSIESLHDTIIQMTEDGAITKLGSSLTDKLEEASLQIGAGNYDEALAILESFINQVLAQSGKKITTEAAELLIQQAEYLINSIPM